MADYLVQDTSLTAVADAIREKGGTTDPLSFPAGMAKAVRDIQSGGDLSLGITAAQVGQIAKITAVDETGKPTKWEPMDIPSGGTDISLGLTAATVGQTVKVKAVDADGKPTEWEAVDAVGGELKWHLVADLTVAEAVTDVVITEDTEGNTILQYEPIAVGIWIHIPADDTQSSDIGNLWFWVNGQNSTSYRSIARLTEWKTKEKRIGAFTFGTEKAAFTAFSGNNLDMMPLWSNEYGSMFDKITLHVHQTGDHIPAGSEIRVLVLGKKPT